MWHISLQLLSSRPCSLVPLGSHCGASTTLPPDMPTVSNVASSISRFVSSTGLPALAALAALSLAVHLARKAVAWSFAETNGRDVSERTSFVSSHVTPYHTVGRSSEISVPRAPSARDRWRAKFGLDHAEYLEHERVKRGG